MTIPQPWSSGQRIAFRFFFAFFVLYIFPFPFEMLPGLSGWWQKSWYSFVPWTADNILHLSYPITVFPNGSGDTTFNYVQLLMQFSLALIITIIWSLMARQKSYNALHHWLRVGVRYYLASMMIGYGFAKVFHSQMPSPMLSQLVQPFGDKSPMGLAWSYVGYSAAFSAFTGWAEVLAGALLIFRRTTALGALTGIVVMANVVAINFCFDVPVKLFSSMLLLMFFFLLAPDLQRLLNVLVLNRPVMPRAYPIYWPKRWMRITAIVINVLYVALMFGEQVYGSFQRSGKNSYTARAERAPLYGIYNAKLIIRNNDTVPLLLTDTAHWKQLIIQGESYAQVKMMNDSTQYLAFRVDTTQRTATVFSYKDTLNKAVLSYTVDSTALTLKGFYQKDSVYFQFVKQDIRSFRLLNRGFRWINEYPYNR